MESASKALIMAAGVLIGLLILALMATLFISAGSVFTTYEETKKSEAIQQFNVNFTKFVGQELTIYEVVTICNFANEHNVSITLGELTNEYLKWIYISNPESEVQKYRLKIDNYSDEGRISAIHFE